MEMMAHSEASEVLLKKERAWSALKCNVVGEEYVLRKKRFSEASKSCNDKYSRHDSLAAIRCILSGNSLWKFYLRKSNPSHWIVWKYFLSNVINLIFKKTI